MELKLFISAVSGVFFVCLLIAVSVILLWWLRHIRNIKKNIPQELLKGGDNEIKIKKEEYNRIKEEIRRERTKLRREPEETRDSDDNSYPKGRGGVPILPSKQPVKPKRKPKEDWPSFE